MRSPSLKFTGSGGLCSRLHNGLRAWYLGKLLKSLRAQLDQLEVRMADAADDAQALALLHRKSTALEVHREGMRAQHRLLAEQWLAVRRDLDSLQVQS